MGSGEKEEKRKGELGERQVSPEKQLKIGSLHVFLSDLSILSGFL